MGKACGTCEGEEKCIDNIRKDLKEIAQECIDWIELAQDRDKWWAERCKHRNEPSGFIT